MNPLILGRMDKRDLLVLVLVGMVFLTLWFSDFGPVTTWVLVSAGILLGPAGFLGWRWLHARQARAQAQREGFILGGVLGEAFMDQIAHLPKAEQEQLLRNLAQVGSRQPTLKL